jgi:hypothetical protein
LAARLAEGAAVEAEQEAAAPAESGATSVERRGEGERARRRVIPSRPKRGRRGHEAHDGNGEPELEAPVAGGEQAETAEAETAGAGD